MIKTSYFAKMKNIESQYLLCISRYKPNWVECAIHWDVLAPPKELLNEYKDGSLDNTIFSEKYKKYLDNIDNNMLSLICEVIKALFEDTETYYLCCYEKSRDFCHRHILAEFLNNRLNIKIKEERWD